MHVINMKFMFTKIHNFTCTAKLVLKLSCCLKIPVSVYGGGFVMCAAFFFLFLQFSVYNIYNLPVVSWTFKLKNDSMLLSRMAGGRQQRRFPIFFFFGNHFAFNFCFEWFSWLQKRTVKDRLFDYWLTEKKNIACHLLWNFRELFSSDDVTLVAWNIWCQNNPLKR